MANKIDLPKDKELAKQVLDSSTELDKKRIDQGWLGLIWGNTHNAAYNISGLVIIFLLLLGIIYSLLVYNVPSEQIGLPIKDFWAIITPIMTLALGYLFGEKMKK